MTAMSVHCPVCSKADMAGPFMSTRPSVMGPVMSSWGRAANVHQSRALACAPAVFNNWRNDPTINFPFFGANGLLRSLIAFPKMSAVDLRIGIAGAKPLSQTGEGSGENVSLLSKRRCRPHHASPVEQFGIALVKATEQNAYSPDTVNLLRARRERPGCCRTAKQRDELAPSDVDCHATAPARGRVHANEETISHFSEGTNNACALRKS
jgi:hypothetical protein